MDAVNYVYCKELRRLPSAEAADLLLPLLDGDQAQRIFFWTVYWHRSWAKADQRRILTRIIDQKAFRNHRGYVELLKITTIGRFLHFVNANLPTDKGEMSLLQYNAGGVLRHRAVTDREKRLVRAFIDDLDRRMAEGD